MHSRGLLGSPAPEAVHNADVTDEQNRKLTGSTAGPNRPISSGLALSFPRRGAVQTRSWPSTFQHGGRCGHHPVAGRADMVMKSRVQVGSKKVLGPWMDPGTSRVPLDGAPGPVDVAGA